MPTYQYMCTDCGHDLEAVQSFTDAALTECPTCSGRLRKKYGSVGVVFKGSGFYRNDSRSDTSTSQAAKGGEKSAEKAGSEKAPAAEKSDSSSSSSKPAAEKSSSSTSGGSSGSGSSSSGSSTSSSSTSAA